jgi:transposase-like protein
MPQAVLRRMLRGVSTREYEDLVDVARDGFGVGRASVSRGFVRASAAGVKALAERRFDGEPFPVVMIDGVEYAGETMVVALGITADGTKRVLGLRQGRPRTPRSARRCWRTCGGGASTAAVRRSSSWTARRPCTRR